MKRLKALIFIAFAAGIAAIGIMPGCDELVTNEIRDSTTITLIVRDSSCVEYCHSDNNFEVMAALRQWEHSGHSDTMFYDDTLYGQTGLYCGPQCHTMDGFVSALSNNPDTSGYPFELWCYTCHRPHTAQGPDSTWDFSLRTTSDVTLATGEVFSYGANGRSNICARCHRLTYNVINQVAVGILIDDNWLRKVRHAAQEADMLMGAGGYEYAGYTYANSHENVIQGCLGCHQDYDQGFTLGGHSLNIRDGNGNALVEECNRLGCHSGDEYSDSRIVGGQNVLHLFQLRALQSKLLTAGLLDSTTLLPPSSYTVIFNSDSAGALYNYLYLTADRSRGMHNMKYARDLLTSSINFLDGTLGK
ncbi:MAG: hypothetical protein CVT49_02430 [candidate division Zixibacteria bacterium HGW-Zixibacteria-1]|nr:MAG: hypothetical protein CVT49_02430 [candidate division Zixibacteria bacterium HGW-Zixibacteria-1]